MRALAHRDARLDAALDSNIETVGIAFRLCVGIRIMNHQEFVQAYHNGTLNMAMDQKIAAQYLSRRLLLPFFMLPFLGAGIALALIGWFVTGVLVFLIGFLVPRLVKKNAIPILLYQALQDPQVYEDLRESGTMEIAE
jgi:hypothetical protein